MFWYDLFKAIFGANLADKLTNYQYWKVPAAEKVDPPRVKEVVQLGEKVPWNKLNDLVINFRSKVHSDGRLSGRPMQLGNAQFREISWGWLKWGQKYKTFIPNPKLGFYWTTGYPVPMFDRHCIIKEEGKQVFHEMIQLDPNIDPNSPLGNNALGWGKWENGKLVEGKASTATDLPAHVYVWTPFSAASPHRCSLVVDDYIGADGTLQEGQGVRAGAVVVLDRKSESYIKMTQLGGECAAIAEALARYGAVIIDRQIDSQNRIDNPTLEIQPAGQWKGTNIDKLNIKLGDFVYAS